MMRYSTESITLNTCMLDLAILKFATFKQNVDSKLQSSELIKVLGPCLDDTTKGGQG